MEPRDDEVADVIVVGFGAAGACTAIEAAEAGATVLVLDRFGGGGASAQSGGVVYAGGGTAIQAAAGVLDTAEAMFDYLSLEVGDAVSPGTLKEFCADSPALIGWLTERGVPFDPSLCPYKTSYPTNRHYLYYSGSELSFRDSATPAPRGHRTHGRGTSGKVLYGRLAATARARGIRVRTQTTVTGLVTDPASGRVTGVEASTLAAAPWWARAAHRRLHRWSVKPGMYLPALGRRLHRPVAWLERRYGAPVRFGARRGVVVSTGGFVFNRAMMREHAPAYRGGLPLGTAGDDGTAIRLGASVGAATGKLDHITMWRFITPPAALLHGVLVDRAGNRLCDESRYGAAIADTIVHDAGGAAWLLVDRAILAEARRQVRDQTLWFQRIQAWNFLSSDRVSRPTLAALAGKAGIDPDGLAATVAAYNEGAATGSDALGKPPELVRPIVEGPFSLVDVSVRARLAQPAPMLTLGGLLVDEETGLVRRDDGTLVTGLYAAGRSAVGICSNSYVSGLSLADCVFSGRRAGAHAARASQEA